VRGAISNDRPYRDSNPSDRETGFPEAKLPSPMNHNLATAATLWFNLQTSNENLQGYFERMERHSALHLVRPALKPCDGCSLSARHCHFMNT
jgi:hypothetical protein